MNIDDLADDQTEYQPKHQEFYDDRLERYDNEKRRWATAIDRAAKDLIDSIALGSTDSAEDIGGTIGKNGFARAAGPHYVEGLQALTNRPERISEVLDEYDSEDVGRLVLKLTELRSRVQSETSEELPTDAISRSIEDLIGKLTTKEIHSGALRQPLQETEAVVDMLLQLLSDPTAREYTDVLVRELSGAADSESILALLDEPQMTTPLWRHQEEALKEWIRHDCRGYVNMATATGKTVLGLSAIAYHFGGLHPANETDKLVPPEERSLSGDTKVLIVAGKNLLLDQWRDEFEEHVNIPSHRTKTEEVRNAEEIKLEWGTVRFKTSQQLAQEELVGLYDLVILDEAHRYSRGAESDRGWRDIFQNLSENSAYILAMSGSIDAGWIGDESVEGALQEHLSEVYTYSLPEAKSDGVIADFSWTVSYVLAIHDEGLDELIKVTNTCAQYFDKPIGPQFDGLADELTEASISTIGNLRSFANSTDGRQLRSTSDEFDELANAAFSRSARRWQLSPTVNSIVDILSEHVEEQCVVLVQSYDFAAEIERALHERSRGSDVVALTDRNEDPMDMIDAFNAGEASIIIGPGDLLGTGIDLPEAKVAINVAKGGINSSLIQRIGRVLRNPDGEKDAVFYNLVSIPTDRDALIATEDGRRFLDRACSFRLLGQQMKELPSFEARSADVKKNLSYLEEAGLASFRGLPEDVSELASSTETAAQIEDLCAVSTNNRLVLFTHMSNDDSRESDAASDRETTTNETDLAYSSRTDKHLEEGSSDDLDLDEPELEQLRDVADREPVPDDVLIKLWDLDSHIDLAKILKSNLDPYLTRDSESDVTTTPAGARLLGEGDASERDIDDSDEDADTEETDSNESTTDPSADENQGTSESDDVDTETEVQDLSANFIREIQSEFDLTETAANRLYDLYSNEMSISANELADTWELPGPPHVYEYRTDNFKELTSVVGLGQVKLEDSAREQLDILQEQTLTDDTDIGDYQEKPDSKETDSAAGAESDSGDESATVERDAEGSQENDGKSFKSDSQPGDRQPPTYYSTRLLETDREKLGEELRELSEHALYPPTGEVVVSDSQYPLGSFVYTFGSFEDALRAAGYKFEAQDLVADSDRQCRPSEIVVAIQVLADLLGEPPVADVFDALASVMHDAVPLLGDDWTQVLVEAGLERDAIPDESRTGVSASQEDVERAIEELVDERDGVPTTREIGDTMGVPVSTLVSAVDSWSNCAAGIDTEAVTETGELLPTQADPSMATEQLYEAVGDLHNQPLTYYKLLDSLSDIDLSSVADSKRSSDVSEHLQSEDGDESQEEDEGRDEVNVEDRLQPEWSPSHREQLQDDLRRLRREFRHIPRPADVERYGRFELGEYIDEFGTWEDALSAIGVTHVDREKVPYNHDEELLNRLEALSERLGHKPTTRNIDEITEYTAMTYVSRFGSMERAIEQSELETSNVRWAREIVDEVSEAWDPIGTFETVEERKQAGVEALLLLKRGWIGTGHQIVSEVIERVSVQNISYRNGWGETIRPVLLEAEERDLVLQNEGSWKWEWIADSPD